MLPHPVIKRRTINPEIYQSLVDNGLDATLAKVVAARPVPTQHKKGVNGIIEPKLADLDNPFLMQDMETAVERLMKAIQQGEVIAIETDHDCDGQTSHAVILTCLQQCFGHPKHLTQSFIGHRMKEGYGLSDAVAERILAEEPRPNLVITADNGSADEPRIARLKAEGIDVIVTDHHEVPIEGPPKSAYAVLNPTRDDCAFPDPYVAGCMVAWLLMAATRRRLIEQHYLLEGVMPMTAVLDFVAVGTVADCVSMARSVNNRAVVRYGLGLIQKAQRPCWKALKPLLNGAAVTAEDLGFLIGPLLNSDGRLSDAFGSVSFLLAPNLKQAGPWAQQLWERNQERKAIQKSLTEEAMQAAQQQAEAGRSSIVVALSKGHAGIHGISASRVKDAFGRPTILFSEKPEEPDRLSGSARSIDALHIRDALQEVANQLPEVVLKFGGHRGAAGLTITKAGLTDFALAFENAVITQLADQLNEAIGPIILTDGELAGLKCHLNFYDHLQTLAPFGREFDVPIFEATATLLDCRRVGQDQRHAQLRLQFDDGSQAKAIWFFCAESAEEALPVGIGDRVALAFTLGDNTFRQQRSVQLMVKVCQLQQ